MNTWKALKFMVIATLSFTAMNALIKSLSDFHAFELVFFRCVGSLIICQVYLRSKGIKILGNQKKLMVLRGIAGVISMALFFASLKLMPFGTTISLRYLAPIFAAILSIFLLKERLRTIQWAFFAISFLGVLLLKGFDLRISMLGLGLVLGSALFTGLVYILLRAIGPGDHPVVVVNYFMVVAGVTGLLGAIPFWHMPEGSEWLTLLSLGVFGYFGQLFMTKAFQVEETNRVAPMKYLEAVFAICAGWIWFGEAYTWLGLLGMFLVIAGMLLNMFTKQVKSK